MTTGQTSRGLGLALALCLTFTTAPSDMLAQEPPPAFSMHPEPRSLPEIQFENGEGETMSLADFKGSLVLLNIWATWCAPCRRLRPRRLDRHRKRQQRYRHRGNQLRQAALSTGHCRSLSMSGRIVCSRSFALTGPMCLYAITPSLLITKVSGTP